MMDTADILLHTGDKSFDPSASKIDIVFKDVTYTVQVEDKSVEATLPCQKAYMPKEILKGVSGIFKGGEVSAIMGSSGAGKTTLLNTLACRVDRSCRTGSIIANEVEYTYEEFGDFANYVMQQDVLIETLTVRETLQFAADLRIKDGPEVKEQMIEGLKKNLKLDRCIDTLVGGLTIKGISGGEKKRTSIAFELISDPQVIFLDEPTSGLDSLTSFVIVRYMKKLAELAGKTIIMTIHQPNSEIYALFDRLTLMVEGRLIYQGPASQAVAYFSDSFGLKCPQFTNPADYFMSIMHQEDLRNVERYPHYFKSYETKIMPGVDTEISTRQTKAITHRQTAVSATEEFCTLLGRDIKNTIRNPMLIKLRLVQTIFMGVYTGGVFARFWDDYENQTNWQSMTGFLFFLSINLLFLALVPVELVFPIERVVFLKEEGSKMYGTFAYWMSRNVVELPYTIIFPLIQVLILYWFVGLNSTAEQFFTFYLICYLISFCGASLGLMFGSIITDAKSVSTVTPAIMMPVILVSGFFKNRDNLPVWFGWIEYISPMKYSFSAMVKNEVADVPSLIADLNLDFGLWSSIGMLIALGVAFRLISLLFLYLLRSKLE